MPAAKHAARSSDIAFAGHRHDPRAFAGRPPGDDAARRLEPVEGRASGRPSARGRTAVARRAWIASSPSPATSIRVPELREQAPREHLVHGVVLGEQDPQRVAGRHARVCRRRPLLPERSGSEAERRADARRRGPTAWPAWSHAGDRQGSRLGGPHHRLAPAEGGRDDQARPSRRAGPGVAPGRRSRPLAPAAGDSSMIASSNGDPARGVLDRRVRRRDRDDSAPQRWSCSPMTRRVRRRCRRRRGSGDPRARRLGALGGSRRRPAPRPRARGAGTSMPSPGRPCSRP